jgi:tetratricopeptide (TPR) repeat protein
MRALLCLSALLAVSPAHAQSGERYARCVGLVGANATQAFEQASLWRTEGGGAAAKHCQGLALVALGQPVRAAGVLDSAADDLGRDQPPRPILRARVMAQAGNAWLLADDAARAESRLSAALALMPDAGADKTDMYVDRARARAAVKNWGAALTDLNTAAVRAPERADILLLRGSAKRLLGDLDGAAADLAAAAALAPDDAEIKAEQGRLAISRAPAP